MFSLTKLTVNKYTVVNCYSLAGVSLSERKRERVCEHMCISYPQWNRLRIKYFYSRLYYLKL